MKFEFFVAIAMALVMIIGCGTNKQLTTETDMLWTEEAHYLDNGPVVDPKSQDNEYLIDVEFKDIQEQVYDGDTIKDVRILKAECNPCIVHHPEEVEEFEHNDKDEVIRIYRKYEIRIEGMDTPEVTATKSRNGVQQRTSKEAEKMKERGKTVEKYVEDLLESADKVQLRTAFETEGRGRVLGKLIIHTGDSKLDLTEHLLEIGYAAPTGKGGKRIVEWGKAKMPEFGKEPIDPQDYPIIPLNERK